MEHADFLFELNSDPEVLMYTGDGAFENKGAAEDFIRNYAEYKRNGFGRWLVELKGSNTAIGWCGLKKTLRWKSRPWLSVQKKLLVSRICY